MVGPQSKGAHGGEGRKKSKTKRDISQALTAHFPLLPKEEYDSCSLYSPHGCSSERQEMAWSCSQPLAWAERGFSKNIFFFLTMSRRSLIAMNVVLDPVWFPWFFCVTYTVLVFNSSKREWRSLCSLRGFALNSVTCELQAPKEPRLDDSRMILIFYFILISSLHVNKCARPP